MKKSIFILFLLISTSAFSQNCSRFYPFAEGTSFEITNYDKRDRVAAVTKNKVVNSNASASPQTAKIAAKVFDDRGRELTNTTYKLLCNGSQIEVDFHSLVNPTMTEQFGDVEFDVTGTNVVLPNNLNTGQTLPDAAMNMKMKIAGMTMNMSVQLTNRKVLGMESVTTSAGTYNCYIISYNVNSTTMGASFSGTAKQWIAEGVGLVKQEDYDDRGRINSSSKLTAFSR